MDLFYEKSILFIVGKSTNRADMLITLTGITSLDMLIECKASNWEWSTSLFFEQINQYCLCNEYV